MYDNINQSSIVYMAFYEGTTIKGARDQAGKQERIKNCTETMLLSYTLDHCRKFNYDFVLAGKFVYCHYLEHVLFSSSVFILYYSYSFLPFSLTHSILYLIFNSISIQSAIRPIHLQRKERKKMKLTN
jgi:hypothetical protein